MESQISKAKSLQLQLIQVLKIQIQSQIICWETRKKTPLKINLNKLQKKKVLNFLMLNFHVA
jgi:hypothetical protein